MTRYFLYLLLYIPVQLFAYLVTPLLPLFTRMNYGPIDNANSYGIAPRLPVWLKYFDTPDNPVGMDGNHTKRYGMGYWSQVRGLYKNSCYNFKWSVLAWPITNKRIFKTGSVTLDYHTKQYGVQRFFTEDGAWQYKSVTPFLGRVLVLNFGWLLDDASQEKALWMFSPRWKKL